MSKLLFSNFIERCPDCGAPFFCKMVSMVNGVEDVSMFYCSSCSLPYLDMNFYYLAVSDPKVKAMILAAIRFYYSKKFPAGGYN